MFLLEIYGVKSHNELGDISNPSSGNSSYHAQLKEVLLPLSHPALCCCTGFTDFFRLTEALTWDLCKLSQVYELELAFLNRIPT